jgi:hypothetical protein
VNADGRIQVVSGTVKKDTKYPGTDEITDQQDITKDNSESVPIINTNITKGI